MTLSDYLVQVLIENEVTDVFGIPGGVVLDFLDKLNSSSQITPHLNYHEQAAAFAALGCSQINYGLSVAYATKGPGFTNLITGIADAYADSIPALFITGHSVAKNQTSARFEMEQELHLPSLVGSITKYIGTINSIEEIWKIDYAIKVALNNRKGPVVLDILSSLWNVEVPKTITRVEICEEDESELVIEVCENIIKSIGQAQRPLILIGNGIRQANAVKEFIDFANLCNLPVVSSRCSEDIGSNCNNYFGYVGSHGIRSANFIFAKSDFVVSIGNRLGFPNNSKSYKKALSNKKMIRIEIDPSELEREFDNTTQYMVDLNDVLANISSINLHKNSEWLDYCRLLRESLCDVDNCSTVDKISDIFMKLPEDYAIVCDVGNNEFWASQAYIKSGRKNRIIYSQSFGVLGNALAKSIGVYYSTKKTVVCVIGDQGLQLNIQELQYISQECIPITIIVINNWASGMIRDRQRSKNLEALVHTTKETGFSSPAFVDIARAYKIKYSTAFEITNEPQIIELVIEDDVELCPKLPVGNDIQDMMPYLPREIYDELNGGIVYEEI